jgi:hypothetical protein
MFFLDPDDPELLVSWPEELKRYNKYVLGVTSERFLIVRLSGFRLFGYLSGKQVSFDFSDIDRIDFYLQSGIGQLNIQAKNRRYRFKIKDEFWIIRTRQIYQIISSMKYF